MKVKFGKNLTDKVPPAPEYFVVQNGTTAYRVMELAKERRHPCYNFTTTLSSWGRSIESICGVYRNHKLKRYWTIRLDPGWKSAPYGIDTLKPTDGQCLVFFYKQFNW